MIRRWQEKNLRAKILEATQGDLAPGPVANLEFVGVLFTVKNLDSVKTVKNFLQKLEQLRLRTIHLGFVPRRIDPKVDYGYLHYGRQDITWTGIPESKDIIQFNRRNFSYIINLDQSDELTLHYLCSKIPARFKISLSPSFSDMYDISLAPEAEATFEDTLAKTLDIFTKTCLKE